MPALDVIAIIIAAAIAAYAVTWVVRPLLTNVWADRYLNWRRWALRVICVTAGALIGLAAGGWPFGAVYGAGGGTLSTAVMAAIKGHLTVGLDKALRK